MKVFDHFTPEWFTFGNLFYEGLKIDLDNTGT